MGHVMTRYERLASLFQGMVRYREEPGASRISFSLSGEGARFVLSDLQWNVLRILLGPSISWEIVPEVVEGQPSLRVALTNISKFAPEDDAVPR